MKETNSTYETGYICGICGKSHEDIVSRANCEIECYKRIEAAEKAAAEVKKAEEKEARRMEIVALIDEINELSKRRDELIRAYIKDYNSIKLNFHSNCQDECDNWFDKLLHQWIF